MHSEKTLTFKCCYKEAYLNTSLHKNGSASWLVPTDAIEYDRVHKREVNCTCAQKKKLKDAKWRSNCDTKFFHKSRFCRTAEEKALQELINCKLTMIASYRVIYLGESWSTSYRSNYCAYTSTGSLGTVASKKGVWHRKLFLSFLPLSEKELPWFVTTERVIIVRFIV